MLKFIKHHMTSISGIEIWPILGFVLFFTIFMGVLWYVLSFSKAHVKHMEDMPFNDNGAAPIDNAAH